MSIPFLREPDDAVTATLLTEVVTTGAVLGEEEDDRIVAKRVVGVETNEGVDEVEEEKADKVVEGEADEDVGECTDDGAAECVEAVCGGVEPSVEVGVVLTKWTE